MAHAQATHWEQEILYKLDHLHRKADANREAIQEIHDAVGVLLWYGYYSSKATMEMAADSYEEEGFPT